LIINCGIIVSTLSQVAVPHTVPVHGHAPIKFLVSFHVNSLRDPLKDVFYHMIFNLFRDGDDNLLILITRGHDVAAGIFNPVFVVQLELTAAWMSLKKGHSKNCYVSIRSKANSIPSVMANTPSRIVGCRKSFKVSHCAARSNGVLVINLTIQNHLATILNLKFSYC
jgi:hypothetical protein